MPSWQWDMENLKPTVKINISHLKESDLIQIAIQVFNPIQLCFFYQELHVITLHLLGWSVVWYSDATVQSVRPM